MKKWVNGWDMVGKWVEINGRVEGEGQRKGRITRCDIFRSIYADHMRLERW